MEECTKVLAEANGRCKQEDHRGRANSTNITSHVFLLPASVAERLLASELFVCSSPLMAFYSRALSHYFLSPFCFFAHAEDLLSVNSSVYGSCPFLAALSASLLGCLSATERRRDMPTQGMDLKLVFLFSFAAPFVITCEASLSFVKS